MFARDVSELDVAQTLAESSRLYAVERQAATQRLQLAVHYADLCASPAVLPDRTIPGDERIAFHGGPGCPGIAEFAPAEYGAAVGTTKGGAAKYLGQGLALRHRLPLTWAQVEAGNATEWKARQIATACARLTVEAAALVDARVAPIVDTVGGVQLSNIVRAATWAADPDAARAAAEEQARTRGVWPGQSDEHGTTSLFVRAATGDVIRLNATIGQIADALAAMGDPDSIDLRRAKAVGILADPAFAHQLLDVAQYLATRHHHQPGAPAQPDNTPEATNPAHPPEPPLADESTARPAAPPAKSSEPPVTPAATDATASAETAAPAQAADAAGAHAEPAATDEATTTPAAGARGARAADPQVDDVTWDGQPASELFLADEPGPDTEADRDTPHPSHPDHPADPAPSRRSSKVIVYGMDLAARHDLAANLAAIKHAANTTADPDDPDDRGPGPGDGTGRGPRRRPGQRPGRTKVYLHITDATLLAGGGVARVEAFGPVFAAKLAELLGHDEVIVQPVIDLNDHLSVDAYEIPDRIRERIKLTYPVEQFPYGTTETTTSTDLDHV
ncbi:MAG TPA: hypothetical protein VGD34_02220, partial [Kribbella sp.]